MADVCEYQEGECWMTGHPEDQFRYKGKVYAFAGCCGEDEAEEVKAEFNSGIGENKYTAGGRWHVGKR